MKTHRSTFETRKRTQVVRWVNQSNVKEGGRRQEGGLVIQAYKSAKGIQVKGVSPASPLKSANALQINGQPPASTTPASPASKNCMALASTVIVSLALSGCDKGSLEGNSSPKPQEAEEREVLAPTRMGTSSAAPSEPKIYMPHCSEGNGDLYISIGNRVLHIPNSSRYRVFSQLPLEYSDPPREHDNACKGSPMKALRIQMTVLDKWDENESNAVIAIADIEISRRNPFVISSIGTKLPPNAVDCKTFAGFRQCGVQGNWPSTEFDPKFHADPMGKPLLAAPLNYLAGPTGGGCALTYLLEEQIIISHKFSCPHSAEVPRLVSRDLKIRARIKSLISE
ncbi:MAG: hypothetical protein U1E77_04490 [Inhella sp.]